MWEELIIPEGSHGAVHLSGCMSINVICCWVTAIKAGLLMAEVDSFAWLQPHRRQQVKRGWKLDTAALVIIKPGVYLQTLRENHKSMMGNYLHASCQDQPESELKGN